jgi:hypothetical protein
MSLTPENAAAVEKVKEALERLLTFLPSQDDAAPQDAKIPAAYCYVRWSDIKAGREALAALLASPPTAGARTDDALAASAPDAFKALGKWLAEKLNVDDWNNVEPLLFACIDTAFPRPSPLGAEQEPVQGAHEPGMENPYPPKATGTPCGDCGEYQSTIQIPMPPHWASSSSHRTFCVDACIASEILKLVYFHGVRTINSCCGHSREKLQPSVIVVEEHIGIMEALGYERDPDYADRRDIFLIPADRVKHIGPGSAPGGVKP